MTAGRGAGAGDLRDLRDLRVIAEAAMLERGLLPTFSAEVQAEVQRIRGAADVTAPGLRDLRDRLWCSIDNDDSRDLDQLTVAEPLAGGDVRIFVAIADVDALVKKDSAIDGHAWTNTTSVYTPAAIFPMLPERLSTDLTSLNPDADRCAIVIETTIDAAGTVTAGDVYRAAVRNHAKLAYDGLAAWLEGGDAPPALAAVPGLDAQLRLQDRVAQLLKRVRHGRGALHLESLEARAVFDAGVLADLVPERKNRATELIEDFMIAANGVMARFLAAAGVPALRRVLRTPKRWDRIVALAAEHGSRLPRLPDPRALDAFLTGRRAVDPVRFPDLSVAVVKLLGRGEYAVEVPGRAIEGHFGLAVRAYTHSTAPNRRFPDLVAQRLVKAVLAKARQPYTGAELDTLALHCTEQEDHATKVERQVAKSAAALLLSSRIGAHFEAIVTGAADKGTWVRIASPTTEGRVVRGAAGLDVGDRVQVRLVHTDVARGWIDFAAEPRRR